MNQDLAEIIARLVDEAPEHWVVDLCAMLKKTPTSAMQKKVSQQIPKTNNADLAETVREVIRIAAGRMSWEALGWAIETAQKTYARWQSNHDIEFLWAGPSPANTIPARRIDQALYDLICNAKGDILLVTFAAAKIELLTDRLFESVKRGIKVRLILEFEQSSEGQLSYDALKAFPKALVDKVEVYFWPLENRERNLSGKPGKLHAKFAVIDDTVLVSSANLTDDAFNRNLEIGVMVRDVSFITSVKSYVERLISGNVLQRF